MKIAIENNGIKLKKFENSNRIYSIDIDEKIVKEFLKNTNMFSVRDLEYIPYNRFLIAKEFDRLLNYKFKFVMLGILNEYETGAFLITYNQLDADREDFIKIATAISHLIGLPNVDLLSGKYYATFTIAHSTDAPTNLLRPYLNFKMHTDGTFMNEATDWVLFMKMQEKGVIGGESRLLHLDDWSSFDYFYNHNVAKQKIKFSGPPASDKRVEAWGNHRNSDIVYASVLKMEENRKSIRFVDQFMHPENLEEAEYLSEVQNSLERSENILDVNIPVGSILVINNNNWVHGRKKFQISGELNRELMRQRGSFVLRNQQNCVKLQQHNNNNLN